MQTDLWLILVSTLRILLLASNVETKMNFFERVFIGRWLDRVFLL